MSNASVSVWSNWVAPHWVGNKIRAVRLLLPPQNSTYRADIAGSVQAAKARIKDPDSEHILAQILSLQNDVLSGKRSVKTSRKTN